MTRRLKRPAQYSNTAVLAALVTVGLATVPALAAPGPELRCEEEKPFVSPPTTYELAASPVSSGEENLQDHLLESDAKSAARGAFADDTSPEAAEEATLEAADEDRPVENGLQSASDSKILPFKRQMYRRDI